jgi:hypothetical protein
MNTTAFLHAVGWRAHTTKAGILTEVILSDGSVHKVSEVMQGDIAMALERAATDPDAKTERWVDASVGAGIDRQAAE